MSGEPPAPSAASPGVAGPPAQAPQGAGARSVAVVGVSTSAICGVRDHARLLAEGMREQGTAGTVHWLDRARGDVRGSRSELHEWLGALAAQLESDRPDAVLLHYSVFAYSHRGLPLYVHPTLAALRRARAPLITVMHEFAYPWRRAGLRGAAWAVSQRGELIEVMRASRASVATITDRADWLASRPWLPRRPVAVAPVFSNLPVAVAGGRPERPTGAAARARIGLFGYSHEGIAIPIVLDALRLLDARGRGVELALLGAPGNPSPAAKGWLAQARERGVAERVSFSGPLEPQALSEAIADCDVLLFADASGPTSRKTTLAASLASGRPLVAIDGPASWEQPLRAQALRLVEPSAEALAAALEELLAHEQLRAELGRRGQGFAASSMSVQNSARIVIGLLDDVLAQQPR